MRNKEKIREKISKIFELSFDNVEIDPNKRWEFGTEHHPKSEEIIKVLRLLDDNLMGGEGLDIRCGGDGDNGETMMYLLDIWFDAQDKQVKKK